MIKTPKKVISVIVFCTFQLLLTCNLCYPQPVIQEWVRIYPDTNTLRARGFALALDDSSNVYVTGFVQTPSSSWNSYCTIKYTATGKQQWVANYFSNNSGGRYAYAIALDKFSNVYVTGYSYEYGRFFDYCTIKYNTNGVQQWIRFYDDSSHGRDEGEKIVIDNAGNIYVSGFSQVSAGGLVYATVKYSPDGRELWTRTYGTGSVPVAYVKGMAVDEYCNVYISGNFNGALTIKYDSSGNKLWDRIYGPTMAGANSIALDKNNNVYVSGYYHPYPRYEFLTLKYSSSGVQEWVRRYSIDSTTQSESVANSIAVDNIGNVYVNGFASVSASVPRRFTTLKYSNSGNLIWIERDSSALTNQSTYMDIDNNNNIYITGSTRKSPEIAPITTIKYDSSGSQQWRQDYFVNGISEPFCLDVDKNYNIYITGSRNTNMCTVKYSQIVGVIGMNSQIPEKFKLFQNYPNPFNLTTKINFDVSPEFTNQKPEIRLIIYDLLGREVVTLVNAKLKRGKYEIEWDASKFPSGVYFYKIIMGEPESVTGQVYTETKKMILLK